MKPVSDLAAYQEQCVVLEPLAIQEEYVRLPADLAYWNEQYATAFGAWLNAKVMSKVTHARLYKEHQDRLLCSGKGKVTISEVESALDMDERNIDAMLDEADKEAEKVRLAGVCEAIRAKKDMLISLGATIRSEHGGDMIMRTNDIKRTMAETNR